MLSPEFMSELGALVRSLESQIRQRPELAHSDEQDVLVNLDRAIVSLIAVRVQLERSLR